MRIQMMPMEPGLCLSPPMDALVVSLVAIVVIYTGDQGHYSASIGGDKHKPDTIGIIWIRMLPDNLYK